jgi:site-specific DNA-cytosine methylase
VKELQNWGPVEDGNPTRNGEIFDAWINSLHALGYSVDWTTLNAANFGDPTSRERLFVMGQKNIVHRSLTRPIARMGTSRVRNHGERLKK